MWAAVIVVRGPLKKRAFQVVLGKRNQEIQALLLTPPHFKLTPVSNQSPVTTKPAALSIVGGNALDMVHDDHVDRYFLRLYPQPKRLLNRGEKDGE